MKRMMIPAVLGLLATAPFDVLAWGGRGHAAICESAVYLVKEKGLKEYLRNKPQMMAHLCNMPDFYWRSLGGEAVSLGSPTHFVDIEVIGLKVPEIPTDYKTIVNTYTGKANQFKKDATIFDVPKEFGSSWWRADQFYRRFLSFNKDLQAAPLPKNKQEATDDNHPYNKAAYEMSVSLGLMGHFVGDNGQPLHTSADYDGYGTGNGGLHAFYEDDVVAHFDGDLQNRVLKEARSMKTPSFLKPGTVIEKMKRLGELSFNDLKTVRKLDPVKKRSTVVSEKGLEVKTPAERKSSEEGYKVYNKMIVTQLARSSLLLAQLWDEAYRAAGRPGLSSSKLYKYPLTVDFIAPNYIPEKK